MSATLARWEAGGALETALSASASVPRGGPAAAALSGKLIPFVRRSPVGAPRLGRKANTAKAVAAAPDAIIDAARRGDVDVVSRAFLDDLAALLELRPAIHHALRAALRSAPAFSLVKEGGGVGVEKFLVAADVKKCLVETTALSPAAVVVAHALVTLGGRCAPAAGDGNKGDAVASSGTVDVAISLIILEDALLEMRRLGHAPTPSNVSEGWRRASEGVANSDFDRRVRIILASIASASRGIPPPTAPLHGWITPKGLRDVLANFDIVPQPWVQFEAAAETSSWLAGKAGAAACAAEVARLIRESEVSGSSRPSVDLNGDPLPAVVHSASERVRLLHANSILHSFSSSTERAEALFWAFVGDARKGLWPSRMARDALEDPRVSPLPTSQRALEWPDGFEAWLQWREATRRRNNVIFNAWVEEKNVTAAIAAARTRTSFVVGPGGGGGEGATSALYRSSFVAAQRIVDEVFEAERDAQSLPLDESASSAADNADLNASVGTDGCGDSSASFARRLSVSEAGVVDVGITRSSNAHFTHHIEEVKALAVGDSRSIREMAKRLIFARMQSSISSESDAVRARLKEFVSIIRAKNAVPATEKGGEVSAESVQSLAVAMLVEETIEAIHSYVAPRPAAAEDVNVSDHHSAVPDAVTAEADRPPRGSWPSHGLREVSARRAARELDRSSGSLAEALAEPARLETATGPNIYASAPSVPQSLRRHTSGTSALGPPSTRPPRSTPWQPPAQRASEMEEGRMALSARHQKLPRAQGFAAARATGSFAKNRTKTEGGSQYFPDFTIVAPTRRPSAAAEQPAVEQPPAEQSSAEKILRPNAARAETVPAEHIFSEKSRKSPKLSPPPAVPPIANFTSRADVRKYYTSGSSVRDAFYMMGNMQAEALLVEEGASAAARALRLSRVEPRPPLAEAPAAAGDLLQPKAPEPEITAHHAPRVETESASCAPDVGGGCDDGIGVQTLVAETIIAPASLGASALSSYGGLESSIAEINAELKGARAARVAAEAEAAAAQLAAVTALAEGAAARRALAAEASDLRAALDGIRVASERIRFAQDAANSMEASPVKVARTPRIAREGSEQLQPPLTAPSSTADVDHSTDDFAASAAASRTLRSPMVPVDLSSPVISALVNTYEDAKKAVNRTAAAELPHHSSASLPSFRPDVTTPATRSYLAGLRSIDSENFTTDAAAAMLNSSPSGDSQSVGASSTLSLVAARAFSRDDETASLEAKTPLRHVRRARLGVRGGDASAFISPPAPKRTASPTNMAAPQTLRVDDDASSSGSAPPPQRSLPRGSGLLSLDAIENLRAEAIRAQDAARRARSISAARV